MRVPALAIAMVLVLGSVSLAAPRTWTITGTVTNHTGTPRAVSRQSVRLTAYVNNAEADWKTAMTDAAGRFTFAVPADPQRVYVVSAEYKHAEYNSGPLSYNAGTTVTRVSLKVFEPTSDAGMLRVTVHHVILEAGEGAIQIAELMIFANPTDRTYVGAQPRADGRSETLRQTLPAGAEHVQFLEGLQDGAASVEGGQLIDTLDVKPGTREIAFSYIVPTSHGGVALTRRLAYPTDRVEVFGTTAMRLAVTPLDRQADVKTEQGVYARYSATGLGAGTEISIAASGLPAPGSTAQRAGIAAFAGIVAAALVYPLLRRRRGVRGDAPIGQTREDLIAVVAALDDRFEAGQIPEPEYRQRRERYMTKLRRIAMEL